MKCVSRRPPNRGTEFLGEVMGKFKTIKRKTNNFLFILKLRCHPWLSETPGDGIAFYILREVPTLP